MSWEMPYEPLQSLVELAQTRCKHCKQEQRMLGEELIKFIESDNASSEEFD